MVKGALIIGINDYDDAPPLFGCENDARAMTHLLATNHDDSANFECRTLLASEGRVTRAELRRQTELLFNRRGLDAALFYFAGHGAVTRSGSYLCSQDCQPDDEGLPMAELVSRATESPAIEKIIILDCCHAGAVDQLFGSIRTLALGTGVSILAACRENEFAAELNQRGLFTSKLCDALNGGAADVRGFVNMTSSYAYLNEVLFSVWEQTPAFKANLEALMPMRRAEHAVSDDKLRKLPLYFPTDDYVFDLDPSYEPEAEPDHPEHEAIFADLQRFRGARLVVPNGSEHMYFAAMQSLSCQLTALGKFYWHQASLRAF